MKKTPILVKFGQRVRQLREAKNLSQEQLAEKADLHSTFIGKIEMAEINPSIITLEKIARAFNIPISQLLSFADDEKIIESRVELLNESIIKAMRELQTAFDIAKDFKDKSK
ncbi:MAG: helix-turn-helix domain-containing protein [bacterium]